MRHGKRGRKLGRTASHRRALLNNMASSLFERGALNTTVPKAKTLRGVAERIISFAKRGDLHARRMVLRRIQNKVVVSKLFDEIAPSFSDRAGGYTRIMKIGPRLGDATEMCRIELVGRDAAEKPVKNAPAEEPSPAENTEGTEKENTAPESADAKES